MGQLLALVCRCFREDIMQNCVFLCSLDNFLLKTVIFFFFFIFGNQILKCRPFETKGYFDLLFTFLVTRKKTQKNLSAHLFYTRILLTLLTFIAIPFLQKLRNYHV